MTEAEAQGRLETMVAVTQEPLLSIAEVQSLLDMARYKDEFDVTQYNVHRSAAEGWRWKASKCANGYDFSADGGSFSRSQMFDHCMEMAAHYGGRSGLQSIALTAPSSSVIYDQIGNL